MANLEQIMADTNRAYDNSRNALNQQIENIAGDLEAQKQRINQQYAQQSKALDNQRNWQAQASSMAASRNGGSFGGSAEIANRKYYQQAYVPAVTQMQTNQANDLSSAESQANQTRLSLQQALAQLNDEANRNALARYDAAVAAEREEAYRQQQLALQRQQLDSQQAYQNYLQQAQNGAGGDSYKNWDFGGGFSVQQLPNGKAIYYINGKSVSAGDFLDSAVINDKLAQWDIWNDIWHNGVSTEGVGPDTIAWYLRNSSGGDPWVLRKLTYNYLY